MYNQPQVFSKVCLHMQSHIWMSKKCEMWKKEKKKKKKKKKDA